MNRAQRRAAARAQKGKPMQKLTEMPITIHYGCNESHVIMQFSAPCQINFMTIEQAEAMREELAKAIARLKEHRAGKIPAGASAH